MKKIGIKGGYLLADETSVSVYACAPKCADLSVHATCPDGAHEIGLGQFALNPGTSIDSVVRQLVDINVNYPSWSGTNEYRPDLGKVKLMNDSNFINHRTGRPW